MALTLQRLYKAGVSAHLPRSNLSHYSVTIGFPSLSSNGVNPAAFPFLLKHIIYAGFCVNPNFNYVNRALLINFFKTFHAYASIILSFSVFQQHDYTIYPAQSQFHIPPLDGLGFLLLHRVAVKSDNVTEELSKSAYTELINKRMNGWTKSCLQSISAKPIFIAKFSVLTGLSCWTFGAPWCGPCRMVSPIVDEIAAERADIKVGKINVDEQPELAAQFSVMSIPTLVVIKDGKVTNRTVGALPKEQILSLL